MLNPKSFVMDALLHYNGQATSVVFLKLINPGVATIIREYQWLSFGRPKPI